MTRRSATLIVWSVVLAGVAVFVVGATLFALNRATGRTDAVFSYADLFQQIVGAVSFLLTGAVISTRRPGNAIGWLCLAAGLLGTTAWAATQWAAYGLVTHAGSLPGGLEIAIATQAGFAPMLLLVLLVVVLFPDGHLLSRRWRVVPAAAIGGLGALFVVGMTSEFSAPFSEIDNPLTTGAWYAYAVVAFAVPLAIASLVGAFASITIRFRRSRGDEREQLKWLVFVAALFPVGVVAHLIAESFAPAAIGTIEFFFSLVSVALPVSIGIAILKYRLYEIDRLISRTLVYGALTLVFGAVYVGLVLAGQALFSSFAGGSNLAIAASTLAVATLFLPVRSRVQRFVDRRFYRRRYDAQRTLEAFGSRLREQIALDALAESLLSAVGETMQPVSASLWLNGSPKPSETRNDPVTLTLYKGR